MRIALLLVLACGNRDPRPEHHAKLTCPAHAPVDYRDDCTTDRDCAIGRMYTDCCGAERWFGVSAEDSDPFRIFGTTDVCGTSVTCRCAYRGIVDEDGRRSRASHALFEDADDIVVACVNGACRARLSEGR